MELRKTNAMALAIGGALALAACRSVPAPPVTAAAPPPPPLVAPDGPIDRKVAWVLRLEQKRQLQDPGTSPAPDISLVGPLFPAGAPDLLALARDPDGGLRRRAMLAIGRVGMSEGLGALTAGLSDPDESVRATAAFAIGLTGSAAGVAPLTTALKDTSPLVRGRAIEGLGLIADEPTAAASAVAIADVSTGCAALLGPIEASDESRQSPEIEACRLALFALVRLRQYEPIARIALDSRGVPVSSWWPVAFALQRVGDPRAADALLTLAASPGLYTAAFAIRGLGELKEMRASKLLADMALRKDADVKLRVAAVRALAQIGGRAASDPLMTLATDHSLPDAVAVEALTGLGVIGEARAFDVLLDRLTDRSAAIRSAALAAAARADEEGFLLVLSGLGRDADWSVRAAMADILATLPPARVTAGIEDLAADSDFRVRGPGLEALARVKAPTLATRLFDALGAPDFAVRATAARLIGETKPEGGVPRLVAAYERADSDSTYVARVAALQALSAYATEEARATLKRALTDREWPVRIRAAQLLRTMGESNVEPERPAPLRYPAEFFESAELLRPAYSPHAVIETRLGTIEIELNVVDAVMTSYVFVELARAGFFNGVKLHRVVPGFVVQAGDPRGDGEGGPGYTMRDELSPVQYVRGTVGMAIDGPETAGSQFFITVSPQPHLNGRYTVIGRVVNGSDLLDRLAPWDVIERVRIWDGVTLR